MLPIENDRAIDPVPMPLLVRGSLDRVPPVRYTHALSNKGSVQPRNRRFVKKVRAAGTIGQVRLAAREQKSGSYSAGSQVFF